MINNISGSFKSRQYLEECASSCPYCEATNFMRDHGIKASEQEASGQNLDIRPTLSLRCYCPACDRRWIEVYRLEGVKEV